jgi:hypothetical protein
MLVNNKFKPPKPLPEVQVLRKTYDFYKETGNKWNSRYLSSKKISRYFLDNQDSEGLPQNLTLSSYQDSKVEINKRIAKDLLMKRKVQRIQLTTFNSSLNPKPSEFNLTGNLNSWDNINDLPLAKLKHVVPAEVIDKDRQGIRSILQKSAELKKIDEWNESQFQKTRLKSRLALVQRHNFLKKLEEKSGIIKIREKSSPQGIFGYVKNYSFDKVSSKLSQLKKKVKNDQFSHQDFRGLLHADYSKAIFKINPIFQGISEINEEKSISSKPGSVQIINFE